MELCKVNDEVCQFSQKD